MQNPYNEDLVEQSAIDLLEKLGWDHRNCTTNSIKDAAHSAEKTRAKLF